MKENRVLAGDPGWSTITTYTAMGLELTRELWISEAHTALAVRLQVRNTGAETRHLDALVPVACQGAESLRLAGHGPAQWDILAQKRLKNGIPSAIRPGVYDGDYAHAHKGATETGGVGNGEGQQIGQVDMDPFLLLRVRGDATSQVLLAGFLSQTGHCARWRLAWQGQNKAVQLRHLLAECEFDGCTLPPGGERTSQWCFFHLGKDPDALMRDFADRVGRYHGVKPPPASPPSVFCTWQYYGPHFTERDLHEHLAHFRAHPLPFDVYLIDECWDMSWGDWKGNANWPSGMQDAAQRIRAAGYRPGIWTCPFLAKYDSRLALDHSHWLLRLEDGTPHTFYMGGFQNYVLDPTYPGVCDHLEELFRHLTADWGYTYHKLDFTRAVFLDKRVQFHDPDATRLEAYRQGLAAVRRGAGPDAYISVCGGHYGGALGLADSQRSGSDVVACWDDPPALPKFKQNLLRTWMNRLWHVDPDAMMVRRREEPISEDRHGILSLGKFTDDEAVTIALNQYLGGGITCFCERFSELDADRRALYRHVIPALGTPSHPLDPFAPLCASQLLTPVTPRCQRLGSWVTLAVINWADTPQTMRVRLDQAVTRWLPPSDRYLVFELIDQTPLGLYDTGATIDLGGQAPHASRLLRIAPWDGEAPVLAGTDLHYSGGAVEISEWTVMPERVSGKLDTPWPYPVLVHAAFPTDGGFVLRTVTVEPGQWEFSLRGPEA
jgi:alpha-galactosidase